MNFIKKEESKDSKKKSPGRLCTECGKWLPWWYHYCEYCGSAQ